MDIESYCGCCIAICAHVTYSYYNIADLNYLATAWM